MTAFYHVRRARPSDRARLLSLQPESLDGSLAGDGPAAIDDHGMVEALLDEPAPDLGQLIAAGRYFVAETPGALGGEIVAGAGWASQGALGDVAIIRAVCVHPSHRRSSIAGRLVEIVEDAAVTEGHDVILAPVAAAAAGLFEALGYAAAGAVEVVAAGRRVQRRKMWKHAA